MNNLTVVGCDPGLKGGLSTLDVSIPMPTSTVVVKPASYVIAKDAMGKPIRYLTGINKGKIKKIKKTKEKKSLVLNVKDIKEFIPKNSIFVIEKPGTTSGNSSKSCRTTHINFGKILAIAELQNCDVIVVSANKWKADMGVSSYKLDSILLAERLSGKSFRTKKGALLDGPAEAYLIAQWYITKYKGK